MTTLAPALDQYLENFGDWLKSEHDQSIRNQRPILQEAKAYFLRELKNPPPELGEYMENSHNAPPTDWTQWRGQSVGYKRVMPLNKDEKAILVWSAARMGGTPLLRTRNAALISLLLQPMNTPAGPVRYDVIRQLKMGDLWMRAGKLESWPTLGVVETDLIASIVVHIRGNRQRVRLRVQPARFLSEWVMWAVARRDGDATEGFPSVVKQWQERGLEGFPTLFPALDNSGRPLGTTISRQGVWKLVKACGNSAGLFGLYPDLLRFPDTR